MLIPLYLAVIGCVVSAGMGLVVAVLVGCSKSRTASVAPREEAVVVRVPPKPEKDKNVDLLVSSLYELTSYVNSQVTEHSQRVGEITDSLNTAGQVGSEVMLDAGRSLLDVNQRLQADLQEAKQELKDQRDLIASCMQESLTDPLTGVANRRAFDRELNRMLSVRRRKNTTFSIMILDIDYFKKVNDRYGHMVGDQLLKSFTRSLIETCRESDFIARFGGEEFVVIMPQSPLEEACKAADRVRQVIAQTRHSIGEVELKVTASVGVKEVQNTETDAELLDKVDKALYAAKHAGRNCCYYHDGAMRRRYVPSNVPVNPEPSCEPTTATIQSEGEAAVEQGELVLQ